MTIKPLLIACSLLAITAVTACGSRQQPVPNDEVTTRMNAADEAALSPEADADPEGAPQPLEAASE